ncbi:DUF4340 domain-containing protein [bacterium]|nr:DUF4340 domain-containing protein [candidate division CSSED10-310 bacterium]
MNKRTLILLALFIVLALLVYVQETGREKKAQQTPPELGLLFPDFDPQAIHGIRFGSFGSEVELIREGDNWFVLDAGQKFPADQEAVDKALDTTRELEAIQLVSRDPTKHFEFQVNSPQETEITGENGEKKPMTMGTMGTEVIMTDGEQKERAHFYVGKNGSVDFMTTYIRKEGNDHVLLSDGYLKMIYGKGGAASWKDLAICEIAPEDIETVTIGHGKELIVLQQVQDETVQSETPATIWKMIQPDRGVVEGPMVQRITGMFRRFRASDFAATLDDPAAYGFESPSARIAIKPIEGDARVFLFGAAVGDKAEQFYFKEEGQDTVFVLPKYRLETIQKEPDAFFEESK